MRTGVIFDIREFAVHDGPGIRTTVFMKGCPLRCMWCHNPEGISPEPQIMKSVGGERTAGMIYTSVVLADILNRQADVLRSGEGGVTFSGGEPLLQAEFVAETIDLLKNIHVVLDTSGFGSEEDFRLLAGKADLVFFDLKVMDAELSRKYTGRDNSTVLRNLRMLGEMGKPFHARVPLVPGVTDTDENLSAIAEAVNAMPGLVRVDLLPYNKAAGGKYEACGMSFNPDYNEKRELNINLTPFRSLGLEVKVA